MPACFFASGSVRTRTKHICGLVRGAGPDLLAVDHEVVAVVARPRSAGSPGRCPSRARSSPGTRSTSPRIVGPIQRCFCSSVPCSSSVGTSIDGPWAIMPRGDAGPVELLVHDHGLEQVRLGAVAAVLLAGSCAPSSRARSAASARRRAAPCWRRLPHPAGRFSSRNSRTSARNAS